MSSEGWSQWIVLGALILIDSVLWAICAGLNASEIASWVQAIGAIGAIGVAILVVQLQAKETEAHTRRRAAEDIRSVLRSVAEEIEIHVSSVLDVCLQYRMSLERNTTRPLPHTVQRFYIYEACAGQIGRLSDQDLRRLIVGMYGAIGLFFETVNQCSSAARDYDPNKDKDDALELDIYNLMTACIDKADRLAAWNQDLQARVVHATR